MDAAICTDLYTAQFVTSGGARYLIQASTDPLNDLACTIHIEPVADSKSVHVTANAYRPFEELTPRENDVARLIIEGNTNHEIADELCISMSTVKCHIQSIFEKLDITSRSMLVRHYYSLAA